MKMFAEKEVMLLQFLATHIIETEELKTAKTNLEKYLAKLINDEIPEQDQPK